MVSRRDDPRLKQVSVSANRQMLDRSIRHSTFLEGIKTRQVNKYLKFLNDDVLPDLLNTLERRLAGIQRRGFDTGPATTKRIENMIASINKTISTGLRSASGALVKDLKDLMITEAEFQTAILAEVSPIELGLTTPSESTMARIIKENPMRGVLIKDWAKRIETGTKERIIRELNIGLVQGEGIPQIVNRMVGPAGAFNGIKRNAEVFVRTAVNHATTQARESVYAENDDVVKGVQYVATLDSRTCWSPESLISMADGSQKPIGNIQVGDMVLGGVSGKPCRVVGVHKSNVSSTVAVHNDDGYIGASTHEHRILTRDGWGEISYLCLSSNLSKSKVLCRSVEKPQESSKKTFYNLKLENKENRSVMCNTKAWSPKAENTASSKQLQESVCVGNKSNQRIENVVSKRLQHNDGWGGNNKSTQGNKVEGWKESIENKNGKNNTSTKIGDWKEGKGRLDRGINEVHEEEKVNQRSESQECGEFEKQYKKCNNGTALRNDEEGVGRSQESGKHQRGSAVRNIEYDKRSQKKEGFENVRDNEEEMARPGIYKKESGSPSQPRIKGENENQWSEGCCCNHAGWLGEEEDSFEKISNGEMVTQKEIWGYEQNRVQEIISLTIEDDPTYVVGGMIVHNTVICAGLDGEVFPVNEGPRPPQHPQCRSTTTPVLKSWKELGIDLKEAPPGTRASMNGQVPGKTTFGPWLKGQPVKVQNEVLGKTQAKLFRQGKVKIDKFTDARNRPLTLEQLRKREGLTVKDIGREKTQPIVSSSRELEAPVKVQ